MKRQLEQAILEQKMALQSRTKLLNDEKELQGLLANEQYRIRKLKSTIGYWEYRWWTSQMIANGTKPEDVPVYKGGMFPAGYRPSRVDFVGGKEHFMGWPGREAPRNTHNKTVADNKNALDSYESQSGYWPIEDSLL
mmetsp:Transcript_20498/g.36436  ORF Transcript_20498/g.36436 Transcript_20498/m.36436 type:complete len:137 (-) Transcript_20498:125-535(-)